MSAAPPRCFRAPGKLMLAGEYSVLGPEGQALALAVEMGVEVTATPAQGWELCRAGSELSWRPGQPVPDELRFARAAFEEVTGPELAPQRLETRSYGGGASGTGKPGVGGSASATVAVVAALHALGGARLEEESTRRRVLDDAWRAHRRAQTGHGSGYDVATSVLGGLVRWRPGPARGERLPWPAGLHLLAGYSGRSAPTAALLQRVSQQTSGPGREADLLALGRPVAALAAALEAGDRRQVLAEVHSCRAALADWDHRRGLGLHTPELRDLLRLADETGAAAKISGAGGGDSAIALAGESALLEEVARRWQQAGFLVYWPGLDELGVREVR